MKTCGKCKTEKQLDAFPFKRKATGTLSSWCKDCHKIYKDKHYESNIEQYADKNKRNRRIAKTRSWTNLKEYFRTHPCVDCGEDDPIVLDFDHQRDKTMSISEMVCGGYAWETILKEIEKCVVRCANCHRRKTAKELGWYQ